MAYAFSVASLSKNWVVLEQLSRIFHVCAKSGDLPHWIVRIFRLRMLWYFYQCNSTASYLALNTKFLTTHTIGQ